MKRLALVAVAVGIALAAAAVITFRSNGSNAARRATAQFPGGISLSYPATWTRVDWCQSGMHVMPIALLTSAGPGPECDPKSDVRWMPSQHLPENGVTIGLAGFAPPFPDFWSFKGNARIGGKPARLTKPTYGRESDCAAGARSEYRAVYVGGYEVQALICGPHLAAGDAAVRGVFASIRFSGD
jgi:hypothetical protein